MAKRTPLYDFHQQQGCRIVEFGGWDMPVSYSGIIEEHLAVRNGVGLFDVSHMGEFWVEGSEAEAFLDHLVTNKIAGAPVGKAIYSPMCQEDGGVVDDLIVYRTGSKTFLVCVNAGNIEKDFAWFCEQAEKFDCKVENQSEQYALLALQGPKAEALLDGLVNSDLTALKKFHHTEAELGASSVRVSRTGYTGEDGFEIYCQPADAVSIAEALLEAGAAYGLKLCGLGARDSLRLEAGFPLYGHEISDVLDPLTGGIGWTVKLAKPAFVGKEALAAKKEEGLSHKIVHFTLEGRRIAREGTAVLCDGKDVGKVVSGTMSPVLQSPIGAALVKVAALEAGDLSVDLRGNATPLTVKKAPLHK